MNSRKHYILDLATDKDIYNLIEKYYNTKVCSLTGEKFEKGEIKYLCGITGKFYKEKNTVLTWNY